MRFFFPAFDPRLFLVAICIGSPASGDPQSREQQFSDQIRPALINYCGQCHHPDNDEDPVRFLRDETAVAMSHNRGIWASVAEQLRNRTMPPGDAAQPEERERLEIAGWIGSYLAETACSQGDFAGSPVPRRLNRDQYAYAIEDLTGMTFDFLDTIPADGGGGEGFDNNGETLFLPPLLMERYMEVAGKVLDQIIVTRPLDQSYRARPTDHPKLVELVDERLIESDDQVEIHAGATAWLSFPVHAEADYRFTLKALHGSTEPAPVVLRIDGIEVKRLLIPADDRAEPRWTLLHFSRGAHRMELHVPDDGVPLTIPWLRLKQEIADQKQRAQRQRANDRLFAPARQRVGEVDLPLDRLPPRIRRSAAEATIQSLARRAWRRSLSGQELQRLMGLFQRGVGRGESPQQAIKLPLKAVLISPHFLFVTEHSSDEPGIHRISDLELASRLSLFLWHSLPDQELLACAESSRLHHPDVLERQVRRMLADPRSYRFSRAFAGQWLGTAAVGRTVIPNTEHFRPVYTTELVEDLRRQVTETMHLMVQQNLPVTDWLDCDYVVLNRRLARHYGVAPVPPWDGRFEKIPLANSPRCGVLGMGAVHMLTSYSQRTSPVLRGGWVLETIFGTRLPAPPPDAGNLDGGSREVKDKSVRQRLEIHRQNPSCAACHDLIDPIGFALENFDVLGRWRDEEGGGVIDAAGRLPSGETFTGPIELRTVLMNRKDEFVRELSRRMLGYALGRSLEDADGCTVRKLTERLADGEYRMQELIMGIVESIPFQYRQGETASEKANDQT